MNFMDYFILAIIFVTIITFSFFFLAGKIKKIPPHKYYFDISTSIPANLISVHVESRREIGVYDASTEYYLKLVTSYEYQGTVIPPKSNRGQK